MSTQTTWPENVIARYLTVGGATVDLSHEDLSDKAKATQAACTGCQESQQSKWADQYHSYGTSTYVDFQNPDKGDRNARSWAQSHADTCRALPMPSAPAVLTPAAEPAPKRRLWLPARCPKPTA
ncbi:hypothetical protein [Streptomyces sp. NBC_01435]|uniref:hypothetical protein n=1 Tax=Streptomyces sp. NBC_01435 TaxID=2903865 RepID=UPI002E31081E|nr:hypothetical protein [Streptomyces sp. NBC_01435]